MSDPSQPKRSVPWAAVVGVLLFAGLIGAYFYIFAPQEHGGGPFHYEASPERTE